MYLYVINESYINNISNKLIRDWITFTVTEFSQSKVTFRNEVDFRNGEYLQVENRLRSS